MSTEEVDPRFADLDLWPTADAVRAMCEEQVAAAEAVRAAVETIAGAAEAAAVRLADPRGRLIYAGAGTSGRLAVLDGVELAPTFGWEGERTAFLLAGGSEALTRSVEGAEDDAAAGTAAMQALRPGTADVAVGVAASGRTRYTVAALQAAAAAGALTVGIACNPGTPLLASAAHPILIETGAEVIAGSTRMKAGTAQKIALNLLSTAVMMRLGRVHAGRMVSMRPTNAKLRARAVDMVADIAGVERGAAQAAFDRSGADIKLAVLIALGSDLERALASLDEAEGNLGTAIARVRRSSRTKER
jgi:N-acetylmuramic acid 6-phosphate etherase